MSETSPTPWPKPEYDNSDTSSAEWWRIEGIASFIASEADANYIVHAVNCHAEMVEVLKEAELQIAYLHEKFAATGSGETVLFKIRSALARATQTNTGE